MCDYKSAKKLIMGNSTKRNYVLLRGLCIKCLIATNFVVLYKVGKCVKQNFAISHRALR